MPPTERRPGRTRRRHRDRRIGDAARHRRPRRSARRSTVSQARWGKSVFNCPFCDGWEQRDQPVVVIDAAPGADHLAAMLRSWTPDVTIVDADDVAALTGRGTTLESRRTARRKHHPRHGRIPEGTRHPAQRVRPTGRLCTSTTTATSSPTTTERRATHSSGRPATSADRHPHHTKWCSPQPTARPPPSPCTRPSSPATSTPPGAHLPGQMHRLDGRITPPSNKANELGRWAGSSSLTSAFIRPSVRRAFLRAITRTEIGRMTSPHHGRTTDPRPANYQSRLAKRRCPQGPGFDSRLSRTPAPQPGHHTSARLFVRGAFGHRLTLCPPNCGSRLTGTGRSLLPPFAALRS